MRNSFTARDIAAFHDSSCESFFEQGAGVAPVPVASDVWCEIAENHGQNMRLWAEEDLARRKRASDSAIAANKRAIDGYNQARNDAIERLDVMLLAGFGGPEAMTGRPRRSAIRASWRPGLVPPARDGKPCRRPCAIWNACTPLLTAWL